VRRDLCSLPSRHDLRSTASGQFNLNLEHAPAKLNQDNAAGKSPEATD
jgi:hypothetical protein